ncbi:polycystic kidney disease 2-like 1 protein [Gigantopelta aegis]|uniref:polycystic kidney disease 2-like 1 protein n=1 Tax=Gigantopelta aegis TaxID=1735272 RepID=UPI001B88E674|nr:polycystic kidney disease 2-like 1 protein [Gigantopelta aegis]
MSKSEKKTPVKNEKPKRSWGCFGCIRAMWATRETEDTFLSPELYIQTTLRELIIYVLFLTVTCIITFSMTSTTMFYFTSAMANLFLDTKTVHAGSFRSITNTLDFWRFVQDPLINGLHWDKWYNNFEVPDDLQGYIYYENKLLGLPRLRQLKVHTNSCTVHKDFKSMIMECYAPYDHKIEDVTPFGPHDDGQNYTAWHYKSSEELGGSTHWGYMATYSASGYVQNLGFNKVQSLKIINHLYRQTWITRGTRAVFIDFTVYNANINLFCVIRLLTEFPATGGAIPSWSFRTVKLIRYVTKGDYFVLACEGIFCVFIFYYVIEEILEIKRHRMAYLHSFWNILDIIIILISLVCIGFNIFRSLVVKKMMLTLLEKPDIYADFERLGYWETRFINAIAIAVFLAWIKVFKYISFNKTMTQLSSTLSRCSKDLAGFAIMFFIVFLAFTQLGYLLFGTMVKDFSSFQNAFFTLFRIILGDFDFEELEAANRVLGPMYFMLYVFFVFFVLINMFLAIINDTYTEVKVDMSQQEDQFRMTDFFKEKTNKLMTVLHLTSDKGHGEKKLVRMDEWIKILKGFGYADVEIQEMFERFNYDGSRLLDIDEQNAMKKDLDKNRKKSVKKDMKVADKVQGKAPGEEGGSSDSDEGGIARTTGGAGVTYDDLVMLSKRVDRIESTILCQLEAVLTKLSQIESSRLTRRFDSPRYSNVSSNDPSTSRDPRARKAKIQKKSPKKP